MNKKLIVIDLDGTTLLDFNNLHDKNIEVINKVKELGHVICISTGRPYRSSRHFYKQLELDTLISNFNGTHIIHPFDESYDDVLYTLDLESINNFMGSDVAKKYVKNAYCEFNNNVYLHKDDEAIKSFLLLDDDTNLVIEDLSTLSIKPSSFIIRFEEENVDEVFEELDKYQNIKYRRWESEGYTDFIEVYNLEYNKATALEVFASYYQIPNEDIIAIGDEGNDIEMIKKAGLGVCVGNANPRVKEVADLVLDKTNKEGAVGLFLEKYFNLNN